MKTPPDQLIDLPTYCPVHTKRSPNAVLMLAHRLQRWANFKPACGERPVFIG